MVRRLRKRILFYGGVWLGKWFFSLIFGLNRKKVVNENFLLETLAGGRSVIICCWHGRLSIPFYSFRHRGYYGIASNHRDAEIVVRIGRKLGWRWVRGSSTRGGDSAYQEMVAVLKGSSACVVAMTPDGPTGPLQKAKTGAVRASIETGAVIIPVSGQASRRWEIRSWDTFVMPKPFGEIVLVYGEPIEVTPGAIVDDLVLELEKRLNEVQTEANEFITRKCS